MEQNNIRQIEEIESWIPSGVATANMLQLYNFHNYNFDGQDSSRVSYRLFSWEDTGTVDGAGDPVYKQKIVNEGTVIIPDSVVQSWGTDDGVIFDYVIANLGLVQVEA